MKSEGATQTLELKSDGSYTETITSSNGVQTTMTNGWKFVEDPKRPWIDLQMPRGDRLLAAQRSLGGKLRLYEGARFYEKRE